MRYPALTRPESITLTSLQQQQQEINQLYITNIVYAVPASGGFLSAAEVINKILPSYAETSVRTTALSFSSCFLIFASKPTINHLPAYFGSHCAHQLLPHVQVLCVNCETTFISSSNMP